MCLLKELGYIHTASAVFNVRAETGTSSRAHEHSLQELINPSFSHAVCFLTHFNQMRWVSKDLLLKLINLIFLKHFIGLSKMQ